MLKAGGGKQKLGASKKRGSIQFSRPFIAYPRRWRKGPGRRISIPKGLSRTSYTEEDEAEHFNCLGRDDFHIVPNIPLFLEKEWDDVEIVPTVCQVVIDTGLTVSK